MALKLRVWHIPQVPMKPFHVEVDSLVEAKIVLDALARYDIFQFDNNVKGDYANAAGVEFFHLVFDEWQQLMPDHIHGCVDFIESLFPDLSDLENFMDRLTLEQIRELDDRLAAIV